MPTHLIVAGDPTATEFYDFSVTDGGNIFHPVFNNSDSLVGGGIGEAGVIGMEAETYLSDINQDGSAYLVGADSEIDYNNYYQTISATSHATIDATLAIATDSGDDPNALVFVTVTSSTEPFHTVAGGTVNISPGQDSQYLAPYGTAIPIHVDTRVDGSPSIATPGEARGIVTISVEPLQDGDEYWTGKGPDNNWSDGSNWASKVAPIAGDNLIFPNGALQTTNNNDLGFTFKSIQVKGDYTFSGNTISADGLDCQGGLTNLNCSAIVQNTSIQSKSALNIASGLTFTGTDVNVAAQGKLSLSQQSTCNVVNGLSVDSDGTLDAGIGSKCNIAANATATVSGIATFKDGSTLKVNGAWSLLEAGKMYSSADITVAPGAAFAAKASSNVNLLKGTFDNYGELTTEYSSTWSESASAVFTTKSGSSCTLGGDGDILGPWNAELGCKGVTQTGGKWHFRAEFNNYTNYKVTVGGTTGDGVELWFDDSGNAKNFSKIDIGVGAKFFELGPLKMGLGATLNFAGNGQIGEQGLATAKLNDGDGITVLPGGTLDVFGTLTEEVGGNLDVFGTLIIEPEGTLDVFSSMQLEPYSTYTPLGTIIIEPGGSLQPVAPQLPTVTSVAPFSGPTNGGYLVVITGTGYFPGETSVKFGTASAGIVSIDSTHITVTAPAVGSAGSVEVVVTTPIGSSSTVGTANDFTYTAPDFESMIVNGGDMYTVDLFGKSPVDLLGNNSIVEQLYVKFTAGVTLGAGAFRLDAGTTAVSIPAATMPVTPVTDVVNIIAEADSSTLDANGGFKGYRLRFAWNPAHGSDYLNTFDNTSGAGNISTALKDGYYQLNIIGANVHSGGTVAGTAMTSNIKQGVWALFGSVDAGGHSANTNPDNDFSSFASVGNSDLDNFVATYGSGREFLGTPYNANLDFNLDGEISNDDLDEFISRYGAEWEF